LENNVLLGEKSLTNTPNRVGLQVAENIDFRAGGIARRAGWQKIVDISGVRSFCVASPTWALFQTETGLYTLNATDYSYNLVATLTPTNRITCVQANNAIWWSNGVAIGYVDILTNENTFFIQKPENFTIELLVGGGDLEAGDYMCCISYAREDGVGGVGSDKITLSASAGDGIQFSWADTAQPNTETKVLFHITKKGLGTQYVGATIDFDVGYGYYQKDTSELAELSTFYDAAIPASPNLVFWGQRLLVTSGRNIYYSALNSFESRENNTGVLFPSDIRNMEVLSATKLIISTQHTVYLLHSDFSYKTIISDIGVFVGGISKRCAIFIKNAGSAYAITGCFLLSVNNGAIFIKETGELLNFTTNIFNYLASFGQNCRIAVNNGEIYSIHF
jgi:hypothetical protein